MRLGTATVAAALSAAASLLTTGAASAADMPSYYAPADGGGPAGPPLEFGSGWYLRGDASFGPDNRPKLTLNADNPTLDNTPILGRKSSTFGYAFGAGAGYKFTEMFRADVTADYLDPLHYAANTSCSGSCSINRSTDIQRWDALFNGYVDIGNWLGITPYVGAGAGVGGTHRTGSIGINGEALPIGVLDPETGTLVTSAVPGRTDYRFAWAAMAGLSYAVSPHLVADLGYRYLDFGRTTIPLFPWAGVARNLSSQQIRLGVRYMID